MRKQVFICIFIWSCYLFYGQELLADSWYHVKWVVDGDSITLQDGRHVRYIGINTPEIQHKDQPAEPFVDKSKSFNINQLFLRFLENTCVWNSIAKRTIDTKGCWPMFF